MERNVTVKKWYVVTGTAGATVTSPDGSKIFCTVPDGGQGTFYATTPKVVTSDDSVEVVEATFNLAPVKLKLLGLLGGGVGTGLPSGYLQAEFLEGTGTQRIVTGFAPFIKVLENIEVGFRVDAAMTESNNWKYAAGMQSGGGDFGFTTPTRTGSGIQVYFGTQRLSHSGSLNQVLSRFVHELNYKNSRKSIFKSCEGEQEKSLNSVNNSKYTTVQSFTLFGAVDQWGARNYSSCKIWGTELTDGNEVVRKFSPVISESGVPCMFDKITKQPFFNDGTGSFIVGMTMKQARQLGKLSAGGGTLTVSLPWEAGVDAKVQDALAKAAENGWTVVVQYREPDVTTENISVDFLEGTGTQWVESNAYLSKLHDIDLEIADLVGTQAWGREDGGFCLSMGMQSYGIRFIYTNGGYKEVRLTQLSGRTLIQKRGNVFSMNGVSATADFSESTTVSTKPVRIFSYQGKASYIAIGKWYRQTVYLNGETVQDVNMALDVSGVPCMHDSVSGENFYNSGSGAFIAGFESTEKAALGLAKLPVVEAGELTVSLPAAAQEEASRVPAAIEVARQRGWTLITQYRED